MFTESQVTRIIEEALQALEPVGFFVENDEALELLHGAGARIEKQRAHPAENLRSRSGGGVSAAPGSHGPAPPGAQENSP